MCRAISLALALVIAGCDSNSGEAPTPPPAPDTSVEAAVEADTSPGDADAGAPDESGADALVTEDAAYTRPDTVDVPALPGFDAAVLPVDDAGRPILGKGTGLGLSVETDPTKRGPTNALAACAGLIIGCYEPGKRSLDACVLSMPRCGTSKPWEESKPCCPTECVDRYEAARIAGTIPQQAIYTVLYRTPRCIPGLDTALGVK